MFTGIIETTLRVLAAASGPGFLRLVVENKWTDIRHGESIAINGVCLTVAELTSAEIAFDVISETLSKTNLGAALPGHRVNAERSLRVGDRIDGHFVQGHVDGTARIVQITPGVDYRITLQAPPALVRYLTPKGSITIDGVSLTIADIQDDHFTVALIPTTLSLTTLQGAAAGRQCNIEADVMSKTIVTYLERLGYSRPSV